MKRIALTAVLLGLAFTASAQTAESAASVPDASPATVAASEAPANQHKVEVKDEVNDRNCLKHTGSRLIRADSKGRKCAIASGRSYTKEDIDRTGAFDLHEAIRRLDPAVH